MSECMTGEPTPDELRQEVTRRYGVPVEYVFVVRAPYRVCPLGAHVDHQLGQVTALALDRGVLLAFAASHTQEVRLASLSFPGETRFWLDDIPPAQTGDWGNFARGAVLALQERYTLPRGIIGVASGSLAEGGLSSSAAFGVALLLALEAAAGLSVSAGENILLDQNIENGYLGLRNGILDPAAVLLSRREHLTLVDCRTQHYELLPRSVQMPDFRILVALSGVTGALLGTDYNRRVDECREAAKLLLAAAGRPGEAHRLGNVAIEEYQAHAGCLGEALARRAEHFFSEQQRVAQGVEAWRRGDLAELGRLVTASGASSIGLYECGSPPLVELYEMLLQIQGVYGARFSGAGFRGCCLALVRADAAGAIAEEVRGRWASSHPELSGQAPVLVCDTADGAELV